MIEHQPRIPGADLDFRDEVMAQILDRGDPTPKRTLTFDNAVISYNADSSSTSATRRGAMTATIPGPRPAWTGKRFARDRWRPAWIGQRAGDSPLRRQRA